MMDVYQKEERDGVAAINKKAFLISLLIYALLVLLLFVIKRREPIMANIPGVQEMEVNIGTVENASGEEEKPINNPNVYNQESTSAEPITQPPPVENVEGDVETSNQKHILPTKQALPKPRKNNLPKPESHQEMEKEEPPVEKEPTPVPKAVMGDLSSKNSNTKNTDSYSQGNTAGKGKMGVENGSINQNIPVNFSVVKGLNNRQIVYLPQYDDDFNKEGTVRVKVIFNAEGNAISASFYLPGSNTSDKTLQNLAIKRAKHIRLNKDMYAPVEQEAIFEFVFKIR